MKRYGRCCYCKYMTAVGSVDYDSHICSLTALPVFNAKISCEKFEPRKDLEEIRYSLNAEIKRLEETISSNEYVGYPECAIMNKQYLTWLLVLRELLEKTGMSISLHMEDL